MIDENKVVVHFLQTYVPMAGNILRVTATEGSLLVIRGVTARKSVLNLELTFQAFTAKKKMFTFKTYMAENTPGWVFLISILRERSSGAMERYLTSITGRTNNRTTFTMKIVSTLLVYIVTINTDGMMSIA